MEKYAKLLSRDDLSPYLSDTQFEFRDSIHRLLAKHCTADYMRKCDEERALPMKLLELGAEQGWFAITLPEEYGGVGDYMDMAAMQEIMSYHCPALARIWNLNVNMVGGALVRLASTEIKKMILPPLAQGKMFLSFALSENGAGSDAAALATRAEMKDDHFVVNGTKMWITGALQANYILTACRTDKGEGRHEGISLLLIPKDTPGITIRPLDLLGGSMTRSCEVNFTDVRVSRDMLVGELHRGWLQLMAVLAKEKIGLAVTCAGAAQAATDLAIEYTTQRQQFGRPISAFQAVSHKLVDMQTLVDASRLMAFRAARLLNQGKPCNLEAAQAKYFATDNYMRIATDGVQVMGANGYSMEYPMQRHFREAKLFQIFGGTSEVQHNNVAREMLR